MADEVANALTAEGGPLEATETETQETVVETDGGESEQQEQANEQTEEQKHKRLGGWQRKIQRLERENELLREMALQGRSKEATKTETEAKPAETGKPQKPNLEQFDSYDKYEAAKDEYFEKLADWKLEQREKAVAEKSEQANRQKQQQTQVERFQTQIKSGREAHGDFDEVVSNPLLPVTDAMRDVILESDNGAELVYWLGKNEAEAARIAQLSPLAQARELGKIEARIAKEQSAEEAPAKPPVSRAPVPPTPPRKSSSSADNGELRDDLPPEEWAKRFRARLEKAR